MKVKKRTMVMMLIVSAMLIGIGAGIIYTHFSMSKQPITPETLVLGIVISAIGIILGIASFLSDTL